ncbi:nuclear transport factor 2 family protein [Arthrobacter sp. Marseille-P9274]|uniref:nuclear transport factor 2 family protein n=1 Tax=Arthrobacter sp. Marseille-P9274 TaxID=2866572 RepID=UPI0021C6B204|nr:nuclear transport factor 2 family protein [Arthrobacter sp. Marseille-P9274]
MTDNSVAMLHHFRAHQLLTTYTRMVDAKDLEGLAAIAHPGIVLVRSADGSPRAGREAFLDLYRDFAQSDVQESQHMTTNLSATELDDGSLAVASRFLAITTHPDGARFTWGRYDDEIAERDGTWVFTAKRIRVTRIALVGEDMLAPLNASSFAPMPRS